MDILANPWMSTMHIHGYLRLSKKYLGSELFRYTGRRAARDVRALAAMPSLIDNNGRQWTAIAGNGQHWGQCISMHRNGQQELANME